MPEDIKPNPMPTQADVEKNNAAVASKLASQDIMGVGTHVPDNMEVGAGLDALMADAEKAKKEPVVKLPAPDADKPVLEPTPEEKAKAEEAVRAESERVEMAKRAEEIFKDSPQLPANASPKSSEAFTAVKVRAAQEIAALQAEREKLLKEKEELSKKLENPVPPETAKELEDHRQWRARLDVEADPKFKEFDKTINATRDFIYAQLKKSPVVTDAVIEEIKKHGGPEMVKMEKIFAAAADPTLQNLVEQSIKDIEKAKWGKQQAIETAKKNIDQYVAERAGASEKEATSRVENVQRELDKITKQIPWMREQAIDAKADENTRKSLTSHNEFVKGLQKQLEDARKDESPEMKAILLAGMAQLFYLQNVHGVTLTERDTLKKQVEELTGKLDKFKKAGLSHIRESGAPAGTTAVKKSEKDTFNTPATSALDQLRDQVVLERERAAGTK